MIRKTGYRFFLLTNAERVCAEDHAQMESEPEPDEDSKKSHPAQACGLDSAMAAGGVTASARVRK